jgi:hypothetical protein
MLSSKEFSQSLRLFKKWNHSLYRTEGTPKKIYIKWNRIWWRDGGKRNTWDGNEAEAPMENIFCLMKLFSSYKSLLLFFLLHHRFRGTTRDVMRKKWTKYEAVEWTETWKKIYINLSNQSGYFESVSLCRIIYGSMCGTDEMRIELPEEWI